MSIQSSLRARQGFAVLHAVAGADDVVEEDELGEGQGIALALLVADREVAELVEAIGAQVAVLGHMRPDAVFQFAGFLVADLSVDLEDAARPAVVLLHEQAQGGPHAIGGSLDDV